MSFDSFGSTDGFDDDFGDFSFGDSNFESDSSGFDSFGSSDGFDDTNDDFGQQDNGFDTGFNSENQSGQDNLDFTGQFNTNNAPANQDNDTKKLARYFVIGGVGIVLVGLTIGGIAVRHKNNVEVDESTVQIVEQTQQQEPKTYTNPKADDVIKSDSTEQTQSSSSTNTETTSDTDWVEITDSENVEFNSEYNEFTFYITGIEHYARTTGNNIEMKSTLTGSISGMSGTYTIDIPYDIALRLETNDADGSISENNAIGKEFTISVRTGNYNGKTVIADIKY